jgi:hypothetical protein
MRASVSSQCGNVSQFHSMPACIEASGIASRRDMVSMARSR